VVDRETGELGGVKNAARREGDLQQSLEDPILDHAFVRPRRSRPHQLHDVVTPY